ncbi:MAG TPA: acyl carrier protein [Clostridiales bacterium]|nr:acyl carrier protein [Clostridiales bacterium]
MREIVTKILMDQLDLSKEEIKDNKSFTDDFTMDSLDMVEMLIELEKATGIKIENEKLDEIQTVGDLVSFLEANKNA